MKTINDRLFNRPTIIGQSFPKESMVIPGQDLTPLEILNQYKRGIPPQQVYIAGEAHSFTTMNQIEKLEFIQELKTEQLFAQQQIKTLATQQKLEQQQKQAILDNKQTTTTINDDEK